MSIPEALEQSQTGLHKQLEQAIAQHPLRPRTRHIYQHWISRFVLFHGMPSPENLQGEHAREFLSELTQRLGASRATRNQAGNALSFFYRHVLNQPDPLESPLSEPLTAAVS
ncbi:MAG: site-specific integrase [Oleiphilaceae bacterium]|nr:site-specific integrase [Oleiphilaceae bacterium]